MSKSERDILNWLSTRGGHGSLVPELTPARFCVFHTDPYPDQESKMFEKSDPEPESLFNFGSNRSLCGHFSEVCVVISEVCVVISEVKPLAIFGCIDCSRSLNRSPIIKFEKFLDPDSSILEQERSRSLKMWLRRPLLSMCLLVWSCQ